MMVSVEIHIIDAEDKMPYSTRYKIINCQHSAAQSNYKKVINLSITVKQANDPKITEQNYELKNEKSKFRKLEAHFKHLLLALVIFPLLLLVDVNPLFSGKPNGALANQSDP